MLATDSQYTTDFVTFFQLPKNTFYNEKVVFSWTFYQPKKRKSVLIRFWHFLSWLYYKGIPFIYNLLVSASCLSFALDNNGNLSVIFVHVLINLFIYKFLIWNLYVWVIYMSHKMSRPRINTFNPSCITLRKHKNHLKKDFDQSPWSLLLFRLHGRATTSNIHIGWQLLEENTLIIFSIFSFECRLPSKILFQMKQTKSQNEVKRTKHCALLLVHTKGWAPKRRVIDESSMIMRLHDSTIICARWHD